MGNATGTDSVEVTLEDFLGLCRVTSVDTADFQQHSDEQVSLLTQDLQEKFKYSVAV